MLSKEEQQQELKEVRQKPGAQIAWSPVLQKTSVPYGLSIRSAHFFDDVGTPRLDLEIAARKQVELKLELRDQDECGGFNSWRTSVCGSGPAAGMANL